ncbi:MAG: hypothetical protein A2580_12085 [Hydrogenophilales bacterium RIFOXYD1_FULL_62_11]|nr:MAG: hypothetical protein A2580_12085 [Hydrogenophilales bacterium RIFOXYD1_FULL_62_11]
MQNLTRIVVATDFSMPANAAVTRAALLARQHGAELHLLHVLSPLALYPGQAIEPAANGDARLAAAHSQLNATAGRLLERYDIHIHIAQRVGRAHTRIGEYANEVAADLVVAGVRGENSLLNLMLGSTAWRLLRVCECPVLVVRHVPIGPYCRVLAAVDFFPHTQAVCDWGKQMAGDEPVHVLHVLAPQDQDEQANEGMRAIAGNLMSNLQSDLPYATDVHIDVGYPPVLILHHAAHWNTDLIVLGRHGLGGLEACLLGSVSKDVAQAANCDVLLVYAD